MCVTFVTRDEVTKQSSVVTNDNKKMSEKWSGKVIKRERKRE